MNININIYNDFDKLNTVILGIPYSINDNSKIANELREDRENLISTLKSFGVDIISIPDYEKEPVDSEFLSSPRDNLFTLEHTIVECGSRRKSRLKNYTSHANEILNLLKSNINNKYFSLYKKSINLFDEVCNGLKLKKENYFNKYNTKSKLFLPQLDGANILKCGKDIFVNISTMNNIAGYQYFKSLFPNFNWHPMSICWGHIDGTITIIKPGLILLHNGYLNCWENVLPKQFHKWDKIFYNSDLIKWDNNYSKTNNLEKGATDINLFSIDRENILVYDYIYDEVKDIFRKYHVNAIPIKLRYHDIWSGGFHCITCDINRDSTMEEYF